MSAVYEKNSFTKSFLRLFPTPKFLEIPVTGIDITDNSVRFLELKKEKDGIRIRRYGSYDIPPNIIHQGKILDKEKLIEILLKLKNENNIKYVNASLPEEQAYLFQTTIPSFQTDKNQLNTILEFKLEENVPTSSRDLVFDYEVVSENKGREELDINITAFPRKIVADYIDSFNAAGLKALSFEIEAQSLARSLIPTNHAGTYMIVDFGKKRTGIAIVCEEVLMFTSTVAVGGDALTLAIKKHLNVSDEEVDKIKNDKGFARYKENTELLGALVSTISILKDEVSKHYSYWNTHSTEKEKEKRKINKIILCGGGANLAGLSEYLSLDINIPVEIANVWTNTFSLNNFVPDIEKRYSLSYAASVGLALKNIGR
jgi:type IV pilus assembly protein PilM